MLITWLVIFVLGSMHKGAMLGLQSMNKTGLSSEENWRSGGEGVTVVN